MFLVWNWKILLHINTTNSIAICVSWSTKIWYFRILQAISFSVSSGLVHWSLLVSLDVYNLLRLITLVLLEQKVVVHSSRPALLTAVGEAICSILFPLSWQCCYIPMCPLALATYIQAPVPFIIGIDSRYTMMAEDVPDDVTFVDLDKNNIKR